MKSQELHNVLDQLTIVIRNNENPGLERLTLELRDALRIIQDVHDELEEDEKEMKKYVEVEYKNYIHNAIKESFSQNNLNKLSLT